MPERLTDEEVLELIKADKRLFRQLKERPGPIEIELDGHVYVFPSLQDPIAVTVARRAPDSASAASQDGEIDPAPPPIEARSYFGSVA